MPYNSKSMRIGITCPYHMFRGGGVQEVVMALHEHLTKRGHYVKILTPLPRDYEGEIPDSIIAVGMSVNTKAFSGTAWQWSVSVDNSEIDDILEREEFDVIHFHEPWMPFWSQQLVQRSDAVNIATLHALSFDNATSKSIKNVVTPYTKPMIKHFDEFTAVSEAATTYFRTLSDRPVTIVPNGIDIKKYSTTPSTSVRHPNMKTILYVGRLESRKGLKYLLRAFNELCQRRGNVQLLIAGSGPDENKLRDYVTELKIPRVTFLGYISEEEKVHQLHRADVFCSPARYGESFGIVLLEAMAAGVPTVAGDNVGYVSTMKDTGALSLVNPQDTIDFARRLELMLFNKDLRKLWLRWAKPYVKKFDYPLVVDLYEKVYEKALKKRHSKKPKKAVA
jgi:phosphatidylinositol alpha-mannosyltransferase